jgi:hypothetical protein
VHASRLEPHAQVLATALSGLPGAWTLERHASYDGAFLLVLIPETDDVFPTFAIDGDRSGLHLSVLRDDAYSTVGKFATVEAIVEAIRRTISEDGSRKPSD